MIKSCCMTRKTGYVFAALLALAIAFGSAPASSQAPILTASHLRQKSLAPIDEIVARQIEDKKIVGAVVEIGHRGTVFYREAFGYREVEPAPVSMTPDTIFDLASLTKPVATSVAIMQLRESGKIELDIPVARYWPAFGQNGKRSITVRQLMTHYSGLAADLNLSRNWRGYETALRMIEALRPLDPPGTRYRYSDVNFEVLGELVHIVSGLRLDEYCRLHIFSPMGMVDTTFRPSAMKRNRIAPTQFLKADFHAGDVNDPTAFRMGGVAGHAGLFSTADDLATFAQMMLDGGELRGARILSEQSIHEMVVPESPVGSLRLRGLGWDLAAPLLPNREELPPVGSYGHTGFTGTMLWIDPASSTYVIVLTNRTYSLHSGDAGPLRRQVIQLVSTELGGFRSGQQISSGSSTPPASLRDSLVP